MNVFGRGVIGGNGEIRLGAVGSSHVGLASGLQDAKRFYFGYSRQKKAVYVVAKNGMDQDYLQKPAVLQHILSQVFDQYRLSTGGKRLQFSDALYQGEVGEWVYKSEQIIDAKLKGPMPGKNILAMLRGAGAKEEELKWTGLDEYLATDEKRTPQEVKDYLEANKLQIEEVTKGAASELSDSQRDILDNDEQLKDLLESKEWADDTKGRLIPKAIARAKELGVSEKGAHEYLESDQMDTPDDTKFESYKLPGGENYREVLFTLPDNKSELRQKEYNRLVSEGVPPFEAADQTAYIESGHYTSPHWDEPNVLAHTRLDDRTDAQGRRMLFVEEIQSDWHQEGRKKGYKKENEKIAISLDTIHAEDNGNYWDIKTNDGMHLTNINKVDYPSELEAK